MGDNVDDDGVNESDVVYEHEDGEVHDDEHDAC